jgi:hypothetical protein
VPNIVQVNGTIEKVKTDAAFLAEMNLLFHCFEELRAGRPLYLIKSIDAEGVPTLREPMATREMLLKKLGKDGTLGLILTVSAEFGADEAKERKAWIKKHPSDRKVPRHPEFLFTIAGEGYEQAEDAAEGWWSGQDDVVVALRSCGRIGQIEKPEAVKKRVKEVLKAPQSEVPPVPASP